MDRQNNDVMTVLQLCEYLQLSEAKVRTMLRQGELPAVVIGRQWRIRRSTIDAWLAEQERKRPAYRRRQLRRVTTGENVELLAPPTAERALKQETSPSPTQSAMQSAEERRQLTRAALKRDREEHKPRVKK